MENAEVVTEGTGRVERAGDRAELTVGFSAAAPTRAEAVERLNEQLAHAPWERFEVTAHRGALQVHDEWNQEGIVGGRAHQQVVLRIDDADVVEPLVAALAVAEPASLHGPQWTLSDPAAARREAQALAVADARDRAEGYAAALGARLGTLRRLTEATGPGHPVPLGFRAASAGPGPDVAALGLGPSAVEVVAHCTVLWGLEL